MLNWHASILILTITQSTVCQPWELNGTCWDGGEEMFCHHWLSSPFSCSAVWDMQSRKLTVTTDVMCLPLVHVHGPNFKSFMSRGEHLSKTWESSLPKWGHCYKWDDSVCWNDLLMSKLVNCSPASPLCTMCGWGDRVCVCVSLVSRHSRENREEHLVSTVRAYVAP